MAGAIVNRREGDRSEYLSWFALSTVGFTAPVPRQEDHFLTDFLVHLYTERGEGSARLAIPNGFSVAVQVKSNLDDIRLDETSTRLALQQMEIPWFIMICDRHAQKVSLYSTNDRHLLKGFKGELTITFKDRPSAANEQGNDGKLHVGPAFISMSLEDLDHPDVQERRGARDRLRNAIESHAWVDRFNIATRLRLPMVARIRTCASGTLALNRDLEPELPICEIDVQKTAAALGEAALAMTKVLQLGGKVGGQLSTSVVARLREVLGEFESE